MEDIIKKLKAVQLITTFALTFCFHLLNVAGCIKTFKIIYF